jgi:drug/metabolite transporter (DMT)-like permease
MVSKEIRSTNDVLGWAFFALTVLFQVSTFLAMRVAVGPNGGFGPFFLNSTRFLSAGIILLVVLKIFGHNLITTRRQMFMLIVSGTLLCAGATGAVAIASKALGSGVVSVGFSVSPLFVVMVEGIITRRRPSLPMLFAMALGICGVVLLLSPAIGASGAAESYVALAFGPLAYAMGSVTAKRSLTSISVWLTVTYQMIAGGIILGVFGIILGERWPEPSVPAWVAWLYLTAFASTVGFVVFFEALRRLPTPVFMSHAWLLPLGGMLAGSLILVEQLHPRLFGGAAFIVSGLVVLVITTTKTRKPTVEGVANGVNGPGMGLPDTITKPCVAHSPMKNEKSPKKRTFGEALRAAFSGWNT